MDGSTSHINIFTGERQRSDRRKEPGTRQVPLNGPTKVIEQPDFFESMGAGRIDTAHSLVKRKLLERVAAEKITTEMKDEILLAIQNTAQTGQYAGGRMDYALAQVTTLDEAGLFVDRFAHESVLRRAMGLSKDDPNKEVRVRDAIEGAALGDAKLDLFEVKALLQQELTRRILLTEEIAQKIQEAHDHPDAAAELQKLSKDLASHILSPEAARKIQDALKHPDASELIKLSPHFELSRITDAEQAGYFLDRLEHMLQGDKGAVFVSGDKDWQAAVQSGAIPSGVLSR